MDAFVHIDLIQEATELMIGVIVVLILRQVNFLFFDSADQPLGVAVLPGLTNVGHANLDVVVSQQVYIGGGCILVTLWSEW